MFPTPPLAPRNHQSTLIAIRFFLITHIIEIIQYLFFSVWLILLSIMPSRFIYVVTNGSEHGSAVISSDPDLISFGYVARSGIARSYGSSFFNFQGTTILFFIEAVHIYISSNRMQGFPFLCILTKSCYLLFFW